MGITYDSKSLLKDGRRWFPIMGEIHFSRIPEDEWTDCLHKMKQGGVNIASSYVFWIHHEEIRGQYDFTGRRDLRRFVKAVRDAGLYMFLRIGPWNHGECRNGGLPDWLHKLGFEPRTNDERYFAEALNWYREIYKHIAGLLYKDGGPIIGIQIENEYGHCGGLNGEQGGKHMRRLARMALETGFMAPLITATGWGGAETGGLLPVMGGYCEAPWDQRLTAIDPSGNFVFTHERNDHNIGADYETGRGITFDKDKFPYLTAELGGGLQVTKHRRPVARAEDAAAMSVVKMGSGASLLGYYMYCGGENPEGKLTALNETKAAGSPNDLPEKGYDFRAPIGAFGQIGDTWKELRLLARFVKDFGERLAEMDTYIPDDNPLDPKDTQHLRYSIRHNGEWGFVFFNNYVKGQYRPEFKNVRLNVLGRDLPAFDVKSGQYGFYPFNMPVYNGVVRFAKAVPLCVTGTTTVFYGESIDCTEGADVKLISRRDALDFGGYPGLEEAGRASFSEKSPGVWEAALHGIDETAGDMALVITYRAESAQAYANGKLVADDFFADGQWYIGLRRLGFPKTLEIRLEPLRKDAQVYLEAWPTMKDGAVCTIDLIKMYKVVEIDG